MPTAVLWVMLIILIVPWFFFWGPMCRSIVRQIKTLPDNSRSRLRDTLIFMFHSLGIAFFGFLIALAMVLLGIEIGQRQGGLAQFLWSLALSMPPFLAIAIFSAADQSCSNETT